MSITAVMLTSCDRGPDEPAGGRTQRAADAPTTASGDGAPTPRTALEIGSALPFSTYRDAVTTVVNGPAQDDAATRARYEAIQADTATCMTDEGFEYLPTPFEGAEPVTLPWTRDALPLPVLPDGRQDAERWGYGTDDVDSGEASRAAAESVDENATYVDGLSSGAQNAFQLALTGQDGPDDPDPEPDGGCAGRAAAAHPGPVVDETLGEEFAPLVRAMGGVIQRDLAADPVTQALDDEWTTCMLGSGVDVEPPADLGRISSLAPMNAYTLAVLTSPDGVVHWPGPEETADQIPVERRYLVGSEAEHRIAVADFDCRASTRYVERVTEVLVGLEEDFVARNTVQLEAMVDAASTL